MYFKYTHAICLTALLLGCADETAPSWPDGAALKTQGLSATSVTLSWPEAVDNVNVTSYRLEIDGRKLATAAGAITSFKINELLEASVHKLSVTATDEAGNRSGSLMITIETPDVTGPAWGAISSLLIEANDPEDLSKGLNFIWDKASDNVGVIKYKIMHDNKEFKIIDGQNNTFTTSEMVVDGRYSVEACDKADNCSVALFKSIDLASAAKRKKAMDEMLKMNEGILGTLGLMNDDSFKNIFGAGGLGVGANDLVGLSGSGDTGFGSTGLGGSGFSGTGRGGGGTGEGTLGLGSVGGIGRGSSYTSPSARLVPGGDADLRLHVQKKMPRVKHCYTRQLRDEPTLSGKMQVSVSSDAQGKTTANHVDGIDNKKLANCVTGALGGTLKSKPHGPITSTFTIIFSPDSK